MTKNLISVHFEGPIAKGHTVKLRAIGKTLNNLQCAIDRAHLDVKHGDIWKYARLSEDDYLPTEFVMNQTRNGGFIADLLGVSSESEGIIKRMDSALVSAYQKAQATVPMAAEKIVEQAEKRRVNYKNGSQEALEYSKYLDKQKKNISRSYGDRSIVKEFDQIASIIRAQNNDGSSIEIGFSAPGLSSTYTFDEKTSKAFHNIVSARTLGEPIIIPVTLRSLDSGNRDVSKAIMRNLISKKDFSLFIHTSRGFSSLKKYLKKKNPPEFSVVACPLLEYGAFDPNAGDMYFIGIVSDVV